MQKFLLSFLVLISISHVYAQTSQLLINENFTGYTNGNLNTYSTGQGGTYRWTASSFFSSDWAQVANSSPLTYSGYTSGTQYVNLTARDDDGFEFPDDPTKNFTGNTSVSTSATTTFYMSFVVRVPSTSGVQSTNNARPTVALRTSAGDNLANFYIGDANSGSNLKFGIFKDGGSDGSYASANYSFNSTYLIVMRYDIVTGGSSNDKMYLWVNPSVTSEPATASANVSLTSGSDGGFSGTVKQLQLFQDENSATSSFDAFKVAYGSGFSNVAANSAAAWNALSPVGVPLPVKFGDIKGYTKDKGIQIDWSVYSEFNVAQYIIERSSDGVSFDAAGSVAAKNEDGTLYYNWFDTAPVDGTLYYRIKNVDIDNRWSYSSIVKVSLLESAAKLSVYPNPVAGNHISWQMGSLQKGMYNVEIYNTAGQQVYGKQISHTGGMINETLELPAALQRGIYTIQIKGNAFRQSRSFLVQ